jgi:hypothetical protein
VSLPTTHLKKLRAKYPQLEKETSLQIGGIMSGFYRMRLASLAAIVGGLLQIGILMFPLIQSSLEAEVPSYVIDRQYWNWHIPWKDLWLVLSLWLLFLAALLVLQWYTTRHFSEPGRKGVLGIIGIVAIILANALVLFTTDPNCAVNTVCYSLNNGPLSITAYTNPYTLAFYAGIFGTFCFCGSLLSSGFFLWRLPSARNWGLLFFFLGMLAMPVWVVIDETGYTMPGIFRVETLVIEQEFLWALAWLAVGIVLWRAATTIHAFPRVSPNNTLEKTTS